MLLAPPPVGVGLLLGAPELLLRPPQPVGQRLQLPEATQQLPLHPLRLHLPAGLRLPRLLLRGLQLQAVLLRLQADLLHLSREVYINTQS